MVRRRSGPLLVNHFEVSGLAALDQCLTIAGLEATVETMDAFAGRGLVKTRKDRVDQRRSGRARQLTGNAERHLAVFAIRLASGLGMFGQKSGQCHGVNRTKSGVQISG